MKREREESNGGAYITRESRSRCVRERTRELSRARAARERERGRRCSLRRMEMGMDADAEPNGSLWRSFLFFGLLNGFLFFYFCVCNVYLWDGKFIIRTVLRRCSSLYVYNNGWKISFIFGKLKSKLWPWRESHISRAKFLFSWENPIYGGINGGFITRARAPLALRRRQTNRVNSTCALAVRLNTSFSNGGNSGWQCGLWFHRTHARAFQWRCERDRERERLACFTLLSLLLD